MKTDWVNFALVAGGLAAIAAIWFFLKPKGEDSGDEEDGVIENKVIVKLKNTGEATHWDIALLDWNITAPIHRTPEVPQHIPVSQAAVFSIPAGAFPLRIMRLQTVKPSTTFENSWSVVYEAEGWTPQSGGLETYIKSVGTWCFNIKTQEFE